MIITEFIRDIHDIQNELSRVFYSGHGSYPKVRVSEGEHEIHVEALLAGVPSDKLDITVTDDVLTISGEIPQTEVSEDRKVLRRERARGKFTRSLELPKAVDANVEASLKDGVLSIRLPIREEAKPRKITIKAK